MKRTLTEIEKKFIAEAEAGHFGVAIGDDGFPFAMGADRAGNLFSFEVKETPDYHPHESVYTLPDDVLEEIREAEGSALIKGVLGNE